MTLVIVQCRLDSSRLPRKALLPLGGSPLLAWTLSAMKQVPASRHVLAVDFDSQEELAPVAKELGWDIFAGSKDDVLERFCSCATHYKCLEPADLILRATADNPFLFYEAAVQLLNEMRKHPCDYITFTGLPHGSGVEVFNARSLIEACGMTDDPYDHEHVGPALYRHPENFASVMLPAPPQWNHPHLRTTVDTWADYRRCLRILRHLSGSGRNSGKTHQRGIVALISQGLKFFHLAKNKPYSRGEILAACADPAVARPVLCVPSVTKGRGTGHLRRCLDIARKTGADILIREPGELSPIEGTAETFLLPESLPDFLPPELKDLINEARTNDLEDWQFVRTLPEPGEYSLILTDYFSLDKNLAQKLSAAGPVVAIDEGSAHTVYCDYLLDIIPSHRLGRIPNLRNSRLIPLPKNRRERAWTSASTSTLPLAEGVPAPDPNSTAATPDSVVVGSTDQTATAPSETSSQNYSGLFTKILVSTGGEDPAGLSLPAAFALGALEKQVTVIVSDAAEAKKIVPPQMQKFIRVVPPVSNLREKLHQYDLVVTHYGFTAFEALAAGCAVILLGTSSLHLSLGQKYGFATISQDSIDSANFLSLLEKPSLLYPKTDDEAFSDDAALGEGEETLEELVLRMAAGSRIPCPVCGSSGGQSANPDQVVARTAHRTFRRCGRCGIIYMGWTFDSDQFAYSSEYFFQDYKKQYGKTYLEDFDAIKSHGVRRISTIDALFWLKKGRAFRRRRGQGFVPSVLDIGCAYGPFLSASAEAGWQVFGTDISREAVEYVQNTLKYPAVCTAFPDFDPVKEFGVGQFESVTMWYVIEHFRNLEPVLKAVSRLLKKGGVFAFSTPSASGVSARFSPERFFATSPSDHYTLWEPKRTGEILRKFGFKVTRIVSTGHHPERFPRLAARLKTAQNNPMESRNKGTSSLEYSALSGISRCFRLGDTFEVYCIKTEELD